MNKLIIASIVGISLGLSACSTTSVTNADGETVQDIQSKLLGEMPIPGGARINNENSLILGSGDGWAGRVAITSEINSKKQAGIWFPQQNLKTAFWFLLRKIELRPLKLMRVALVEKLMSC